MKHQWKPRGWLAIILGLFFQPFVFLYVNRPKYFFSYLVLIAGIIILDLKLHTDPVAGVWYESIYFSWIIIVLCPIHAFIITRNYDSQAPRGCYASWWGTSLCFIAVMASLIALRSFYFEPFTIPAKSMSPTLNPGDQIIVGKSGFGNYRYLGMQVKTSIPSVKPARGDVIVFQYPPDPQIDYVKRVIGLPGDRIIYRNKSIYIKQSCSQGSDNCPEYEIVTREAKQQLAKQLTKQLAKHLTKKSSKELPADVFVYEESIGNNTYKIWLNSSRNDFVNRYFNQAGTRRDEWLVPEGHYFVLGDNRDNSADSRYWGFVPQENIIGKVIYVW